MKPLELVLLSDRSFLITTENRVFWQLQEQGGRLEVVSRDTRLAEEAMRTNGVEFFPHQDAASSDWIVLTAGGPYLMWFRDLREVSSYDFTKRKLVHTRPGQGFFHATALAGDRLAILGFLDFDRWAEEGTPYVSFAEIEDQELRWSSGKWRFEGKDPWESPLLDHFQQTSTGSIRFTKWIAALVFLPDGGRTQVDPVCDTGTFSCVGWNRQTAHYGHRSCYPHPSDMCYYCSYFCSGGNDPSRSYWQNCFETQIVDPMPLPDSVRTCLTTTEPFHDSPW